MPVNPQQGWGCFECCGYDLGQGGVGTKNRAVGEREDRSVMGEAP